jgi:hypothetical protein
LARISSLGRQIKYRSLPAWVAWIETLHLNPHS